MCIWHSTLSEIFHLYSHLLYHAGISQRELGGEDWGEALVSPVLGPPVLLIAPVLTTRGANLDIIISEV